MRCSLAATQSIHLRPRLLLRSRPRNWVIVFSTFVVVVAANISVPGHFAFGSLLAPGMNVLSARRLWWHVSHSPAAIAAATVTTHRKSTLVFARSQITTYFLNNRTVIALALFAADIVLSTEITSFKNFLSDDIFRRRKFRLDFFSDAVCVCVLGGGLF